MLASPPEVSAVALKAFWQIAERWRLNDDDRATILSVRREMIPQLRSDSSSPDLSRDQVERISYLLGIFAGLHTIFGDVPLADDWITTENADFGDRRPLDRILAGNVGDLAYVREYVDRWVAGW